MRSLRELTLVFFFMFPGSLLAQIETGLQFNLSTPGSRSLGMGGAFIGFADDATAAYTNPAGLTSLTLGGSEIAVEARNWDYSTLFLERGHIGDTMPFGVGIDTVAGFQSGEARSSASGLSFASVGYLLPRGITVALYHHQLAKFRSRGVSQGLFDNEEEDILSGDCANDSIATFHGELIADGDLFFNDCRFTPYRFDRELEITNDGVSAAWQIPIPALAKRKQSLSVGLGLSYYQLDVRARTDALFFFGFTGSADFDRLPRGFVGPADTLDDNVFWSATNDGSDDALGLNLGLLWRLEPHWSIGAVYRQGPDFRYKGHVTTGPALERFYGIPRDVTLDSSSAPLHVPDVYGLGVAYTRNEGNTKVALDINRVRYSQRLVDLVSTPADFQLGDVNEIHLGFEQVVLVLPSQFVGTLRLGVWHEPNHEPTGKTEVASLFFPKGEDEIHWAGGLGLVVKEDYQIDAAVDLSDRVNTFSFSIVRFF
ncbi:MAG TPA: hypothetical protein VF789_05315 [Thermoanaerobaculia bacterium]